MDDSNIDSAAIGVVNDLEEGESYAVLVIGGREQVDRLIATVVLLWPADRQEVRYQVTPGNGVFGVSFAAGATAEEDNQLTVEEILAPAVRDPH